MWRFLGGFVPNFENVESDPMNKEAVVKSGEGRIL